MHHSGIIFTQALGILSLDTVLQGFIFKVFLDYSLTSYWAAIVVGFNVGDILKCGGFTHDAGDYLKGNIGHRVLDITKIKSERINNTAYIFPRSGSGEAFILSVHFKDTVVTEERAVRIKEINYGLLKALIFCVLFPVLKLRFNEQEADTVNKGRVH